MVGLRQKLPRTPEREDNILRAIGDGHCGLPEIAREASRHDPEFEVRPGLLHALASRLGFSHEAPGREIVQRSAYLAANGVAKSIVADLVAGGLVRSEPMPDLINYPPDRNSPNDDGRVYILANPDQPTP